MENTINTHRIAPHAARSSCASPHQSKPSSRTRRLVLLLPLLAALLLLPALPARAQQPGSLRLSVQQAVSQALKHNLSLKAEKLNPTLSKAAQRAAEADFEPALFVSVDSTHSPGQVSSQRAGLSPASSTGVGGTVGARKSFSTGTSLELSLSTKALFGGGGLDPAYQSRAGLTARQSLLRGVSKSANEVSVTTASMARTAAQQTLSRKAEQVVADTLGAYFDLHSALSADAVQSVAVEAARKTLADTRQLIAAGKLAGSEEIAVQYTLQTRLRDQLKSQQAVASARDRLARLTGMVGPRSLATPRIVTTDSSVALPRTSDLQGLLDIATSHRGDLLAARQKVQLQQAKLSAAKHRTLPSLDLVGSVFVTGLSGESSSGGMIPAGSDGGYWNSYQMSQFGWSIGLVLDVPLGNKKADSARQTAELELRRARASVDVVLQGITAELNSTWRALALARSQLKLTLSAEKVARTKLSNEEARYRAGKTSAHILASVQAEALKERLASAQAVADVNKALVKLHSAAGDLLPRMQLKI